MTLNAGTKLGSYEVIAPIGAGGMGEVYKARDTKLGRDVAIKVLREELASDPNRLRRFEQEARSASALNHPNIVHIYDIGEHGSTSYIAMEFVEGKTLREIVSEGPLPTKKLLQFATQTAEGLAKAHAAGIIHRDLKPENLMVTIDGYVKILDFGLAKLMPVSVDARSEMLTITKDGTSPGVVMGTVAYMSPEQASGRKVDYRSDQFSLGLILYEIGTGRIPFKRETVAETLTAIIREEPEPIATVNPNLPAPLRWIVERCLAKDPEERYVSTSDLAKELQGLRDHISEVPSEPIGVPPVRRRFFTRKSLLTTAGLLAVVLALVIGLNVGGLRDRLLGESRPGPIESLAVLPLENLSGDPEQEYFADGMTEALITDLTKIGALKVISRTSAMRYKGTDKPLPQIARELNVEAVVEGSVLRAGDRVRITAQLIHAATDQHLWAESYERDLGDILALQSEVARAIAGEIKVKLTPQEDALLTRARQIDPGAHEAFLRGRYYWNKHNPGGYEKAVEYFEQAIEKDPSYAVAYAGLADSYIQSPFWRDLPPRETYPKAREAVKKAIEIDDTLGEAHASLAAIHMYYDWDFEAAEREFKRALELAPNSSYSRVYYSLFLNLRRRYDEAVAEARKAQELDPVSSFSNTHLGHRLWQARRYDEAIEEFKKWLVIEPNDWFAHHHLGQVYQEKMMIKEAIAEFEKGMELSGGIALVVANVVMTHHRFGDKEVAERHLDSLKERVRHEYVPPMCFAMIYLARGDTDQAFEWVKKAHEERDSFLPWIRISPLDSLDFPSDPRINELLDRLGLP